MWNRNFVFIWMSNYFLFTAFYALIATLPIYIISELEGTTQQVGVVTSVFLLSTVLFRPLSGRWLDILGRKYILLPALALFLAFSMMYVWVTSVSLLIALRFLHGISFGLGSTATGTVATDVIPEGRKGEGIGYYALSYNIAMVTGPFFGLAIVNVFPFRVLFLVLSLISLLSFLFAVFTNSAVIVSKAQPTEETRWNWRNYIEPRAVPASLTGMVLSFTFSGFLTFIPIYAKDIGLPQLAGAFFATYALAMVFSRPFTGKAFDHYGPHVVVYPCIALYVVGLIGLSQANSPASLLLAAAVIGAGFGSLSPCLQSIAVKVTQSRRRGLAIGTYLTFFDIGVGLGAIILGIVASNSGFRYMYICSSLIVASSAMIYYVFSHRNTD